MNDNLQAVVIDIIARAPEWIRADLASKDAPTRQRAEEALAAKIADALGFTSSAARFPEADAQRFADQRRSL